MFAALPILACMCLSCTIPVATVGGSGVVPVYVSDNRDIGGTMDASLRKLDLTGNSKFSQSIEVHYLSPELAQKVVEDPSMLDALIKK